MVEKIQMNVNETLELDYLVEKVSSNAIDVTNEPNNVSTSIDYISTETGIFNPPDTGPYKLEINGQTIEIEVYDIPNSAIRHYPFSSGSGSTLTENINGQDGTIIGDPVWVNSSAYKDGYALDFDGADDYVDIPNVSHLLDYTILLWMDTDGLTGKKNTLVNLRANNDIQISYLDDGTLTFYHNSGGSFYSVSTTLSTDTFSFFACRYSNSDQEMQLYRDGSTPVDSTTGVGESRDVNFTDKVSRRGDNNQWHHNGFIDDLLICDAALSQGEIGDWYNSHPSSN